MRQVKANILDFPKPSLDSLVWEKGQSLKPDVKQFILDFISSFAQANNLKDTNAWITEVKFVGSLTTNCYNSNSDMDIHIGVDLSKFIEVERPEMSEKEASEYLDKIRMQVDQVKAKVLGTEHAIEIYFETKYTNKASQEFSGVYSVLEDKWTKYPHIVDQNFDIEKLHPELLELAKETASELDEAFGDIKREVADIKDLQNTISEWPEQQRESFEKKLQKKLDDLEIEIEGLVDIREDVAEKRKDYKALSEQEVRFKYLQKYFYMHVLTDLKTLLKQSPELSTKDIPVVENIMSQSNLKLAYQEDENRILVDMDDTICKELPDGECGEPMEGVKEALTKLKEQGFEIVIFSHRADDQHGQDEIKQYLEAHEIPYDSIFQGEKPLARFQIDDRAIHFDNWNSVLKQIEKSDKKASLITAYDRHGAYWIDPNGKVYPIKTTHEDWFFENEELLRNQYHYDKDEIGQDWWDIKTGNLLNQLLEDGWLRVGDLFVAGRKSIGTGIEIANLNSIPSTLIDFVANFGKDKYWQIEDLQRRVVELSVEELVADGQEAVNQALQREKMQSRRPVAAALNLPIIDPKTLTRKEPYALFIGTQMFSKKEGLDLFDVFGQHPMITEHNRVPTVTLDTLIKENIPVIGKEPKAGDKQPFQDISRVVKTAAHQFPSWASSAWISPQGKVFDLEGDSHEDAIVDLVDDPKIHDVEDPNSYAIKKGWTRFGEMGGGMESGLNVKDIRNIPSFVFDYVTKYSGDNREMVVADIKGQYAHMSVDVFVLGQKAVNKALQQEKLNTPKDSNLEFVEKNYPELLVKDSPFIDYFWDQYRGKISHFDDLRREDLTKIINEYKSGIKTTAQLSSDYDFSSTQFNIPKELSEKIIRWAVENIPEDQIIHDEKDPGTKGIQLESHITLKYGLKTDNFEEIEKALEGEKAPHIKFGKTSFFEPKSKDYDVVIIAVESEDLQNLNKKLCDNVKHEDTQGSEYHPHVTVAYVQRGKGKDFDGKDIITGEELDLPELIFSPKTGEKRTLELRGTNKSSSFMPSNTDLAPSDDWAGTVGYPTNESMDAPQNVSDESTWHSPENDRPRSTNFLKRMLSLFQKPLSKKEEPKNIVPVKEARLIGDTFYGGKLWFDPSGQVYEVGRSGSHADWILNNAQMLKDEYGFDSSKWARDSEEDIVNYEELNNSLISAGWARVGDIYMGWGIQVKDLQHVPEYLIDNYLSGTSGTIVFEDLSKNWVEVDVNDFVTNGQKAINKALSQKRMSIAKQASPHGYGGWISPTGEVILAKDHGWAILEDPKTFGFDKPIDKDHVRWQYVYESLYNKGWLQFRIWGNGLHFSGSNLESMKKAENIIFNELDSVSEISLNLNDGNYTATTEEFKEKGFDAFSKHVSMIAKQWTTPKEQINQPGMDWQWADYIYQYVDENWQDWLVGWMNLNPKNYVKPVILIEKIYQDEGAVSAWVHIEFVNLAGNTDAYMKLIITGDIEGAESIEPEGREFHQTLTNWEIDVKDFGVSEELEKTSAFTWAGPAYRVQTGYEHDPKATAADVVRFEQEELGNQLGVTPDTLAQLSNIPASNVVWVTKTRKDAGRYKSSPDDIVDQINVPENSLILAEDGDGGYLVLIGGFEKNSSYGPTNYKGPSVADHGYQNSAWDDMNVTYSPEEDEELDDQNGAGGYPNRWFARHRGPYYTNEGKVVKMLEDTKPQKQASISGDIINHILNLIHQNGGATWNMAKGNLVGQPYFAVAIYPEKEQIVPEADFENLEEYIVNNEGLLNNPDNSFGAWVSGGKTYYDVVATIVDKNEAIKLGQQHKQLAIFNLQTLQEIPIQKVAKLAAAVSDRQQQEYYNEIYRDRWGESVDNIDGGNEYYDYSELNGNDYPAAKDLDKERALLDQLENPADRNVPQGLGEYAITYYDAMPAGNDDGGI